MHDICVVGFGALGAIYSLVLERSANARVTAVCRSNYRVVVDHGLEIASDKFGTEAGWRPHRVVSCPQDAADRSYDFIVCCFKALPDLISTPALLAPLLTKTTTFVLVQNGIGIERDLQRAVPRATIISACAWIDATAINGGRMVTHGLLERLTLGVHAVEPATVPTRHVSEKRQFAEEALDLFVNLLRLGGSTPEPTHNIDAERWRKVLWNAAYSTLCTLTRAPVSALLEGTVLRTTLPLIRTLMAEVVSVARAAGIDESALPEAAIEATIELSNGEYGEDPTGQRVPREYRPSMLVDLEAGRAMEVEAIVGGIVAKGKELGVATPQLDIVYGALRVMQNAVTKIAESIVALPPK